MTSDGKVDEAIARTWRLTIREILLFTLLCGLGSALFAYHGEFYWEVALGPLGVVFGPALIYVGWSRKLLVTRLMGTFVCLCTLMWESWWFILGQSNNAHFIEELLYLIAIWITAPAQPVADFVDGRLPTNDWLVAVLTAIGVVALVETAVIWFVAVSVRVTWRWIVYR